MLICPHSYLSVDHSVFFNTDLGIFQGRIRKKKGIFIQVPTVLMARFGLFGCRFLISSPVPPPPPQKNVHIMVLILDILESVLTIRHPGLTLL